MSLVLSTFSGAEFLDRCFEEEGFCVVNAGDILFGRDIRAFHPPAGVFHGVIGGPPCQAHSSLANLVRAKGLEPRFGDMTGEFVRVIEAARPVWFLMENVPKCPDPKPQGYEVTSFRLRNEWLGEAQMRDRRFWFGIDANPYGTKWHPCPCCDDYWCRIHWEHANKCDCPAIDEPAPNLMRWIPGVALECMESETAVAAGTGGGDPENPKYRKIPNRSLEEMLELQGYPPDVFGEHTPFTMQARRRMVGNAVPHAMGRAVAQAVRKAIQ